MPPGESAAVARLGFDYVEWPMRSTVGSMSDDEYRELLELARGLSVRPEAWNVMLPPEIAVVGPEADQDAMERYLETAYSRASELGGEVVVFGSGGSRRVPEGWAMDTAWEQFDEACARAGDVASRHGITIALEPLNSGETNLLNTVAEGREVVRRVSHPNVRLLSDIYHVAKEDEPFEATGAAADVLAHVHVSTHDTRQLPLPETSGTAVRDYLAALKRSGYDRRISIECRWSSLDDARRALEYLHRTWDEV